MIYKQIQTKLLKYQQKFIKIYYLIIASIMKQQVKQTIGNEYVPFPSYHHTVRPPTTTNLQQSLKTQFTSSSLGQKPSYIKPEVPRQIFYNLSESLHYAKQRLMPKTTNDQQQRKFQNKIYGSMERSVQGDKKQQVIEIEEWQQMQRSRRERQVARGNIMVKQNIKIKQIPLQYKLPSANSNRASLKTDSNSEKLPKHSVVHNYGQQSRINQDWNRTATSNSQKPYSKDRKQVNQPHSALGPSLKQHAALKNEQQTQRSVLNQFPHSEQVNYYSKLYPSHNSVNYSGVYSMQQFPGNPSTNYPQLINSPHYPMLNNQSTMLWNTAYNQQNHSYLYGLLENRGSLGNNNNDPSYNSNNYNSNNININNHASIIKDTIYSKEPQLILQHSLSNNISNQHRLKEQQLRKKTYYQNQSATKQHQKKDISRNTNQKKNNPNVIVLDSDEEQHQPNPNTNQNHDKQLKVTEKKVINSIQLPPHPFYPAYNPSRSIPAASQYNPATYQYEHTQLPFAPYSQGPYSPAQTFMRYQQSQPQYKSSHTSKQYKQLQFPYHHLQKKKPIYKQRKDHRQMKTFNDDKHRLMLERFQDISKIKEMYLDNHKDSKIGMKHHNMQQRPIITRHEIKTINNLPPQTLDPYTQQKILNINNYLAMGKLQSDLKDVKDMRDVQSKYNNGASRREERLQSVDKLKKRNQLHISGQNLNNSNNNSSQTILKSNPNSSFYPCTGKEISGNDHVKRQARKAFLKTRTRISSQQVNIKQSNSLQVEKKSSKKQRHYSDIDFDKSMINHLSSQISTKMQTFSLQQSSEEKQKPTGYVFEWTPRLKRLRDLSKKRDYDSVILVGPDFQADIPRFMTDQHQLRVFKAIKRRGLLERMYKHSSEISLRSIVLDSISK